MPLDGVTWLNVAAVGPEWDSGVSVQYDFPRIIDEDVVATNNKASFVQKEKNINMSSSWIYIACIVALYLGMFIFQNLLIGMEN